VPKKSRFTSKEVALFQALKKKRVPFLIVGLSAASLQGAPVVTEDIDLWVKDLGDPKFREALKEAGGFYIQPWGLNPPMIGGAGLELIDLVITMHGLKSFDYEYKRSRQIDLGGVSLRVLPLQRIIKSKRAAGRKKDRAVLPVLEDAFRTVRAKKKS